MKVMIVNGTRRSLICIGTWGLTIAALLFTLLAASDMAVRAEGEPHANRDTLYLFTYFVGNGEDGLHLACSEDGLLWKEVAGGQSFLKPEVGSRLMRDPCLILGPDGVFHMVWTTGWGDRGIGLAHSRNLREWTPQVFVPVMEKVPGAKNCWAPEIIWDIDTQQYVIFWSSTVEGRFAETAPGGDNGWNHRIYMSVTKDFGVFSEPELFYEPGFNVIDATITPGPKDYVMIIKNETRHPPAKNLCVAFAERILGPWSPPSEPFSPKDMWVEGPTVLQVGSWWYVYFDAYVLGKYGAMRTRDFRHFEDVTAQGRFPRGMRHGTALAVPRDIVLSLEQKASP